MTIEIDIIKNDAQKFQSSMMHGNAYNWKVQWPFSSYSPFHNFESLPPHNNLEFSPEEIQFNYRR